MLCESWQRVAGHAHDGPFGHSDGTERVVEIDGRLVPIKYGPLEARTLLSYSDGSNPGQQALANAMAAILRPYEEVFKADTGVSSPGSFV